MTAQSGERLIYNNEIYRMAAEPLEQYLSNLSDRPALYFPNTACWRGYYGGWEIKDNKLYLVELIIYPEHDKVADIEFLFPGKQEVFAEWFSGEIRVPKGQMLEYIHAGYESIFEEDLFLKFRKGELKVSLLVNNNERWQIFLRAQEKRNTEYDDLPF